MKLFSSFTIGGQDWTAHTVTRKEMRAISEDVPDGITMFDTQRIIIRATRNKSRFRDTFLHEMCHAFLDASGVGATLAAGYKGEDFGAWEEQLIRLFVPHLAALIDHLEEQKK